MVFRFLAKGQAQEGGGGGREEEARNFTDAEFMGRKEKPPKGKRGGKGTLMSSSRGGTKGSKPRECVFRRGGPTGKSVNVNFCFVKLGGEGGALRNGE